MQKRRGNEATKLALASFTIVVLLALLIFFGYRAYKSSLFKPLKEAFEKGKPLTPTQYLQVKKVFKNSLRDEEGNTLLHRLVVEACSGEPSKLTVLETFLREGLNPNARNDKGQTPIHLAVKYCKGKELRKVLSLLKKYGGDINASDYAGNTPLFYAVDYSAYPSQLQVLLDFKPEINPRNLYGWTPLCKAAFLDLNRPFALLHQKGGEVSVKCWEVPLSLMVKELKSTEVASYLKKAGVELPKEKPEERLRKLLAPEEMKSYPREDFERNVEDALALAIYLDRADRVEAFFEHSLFSKDEEFERVDIPIGARGLTPLMLAVKFCSPKVLAYLLKDADPNMEVEEGKPIIHYCTREGCLACVELLIEKGANLEALDDEDFTPYCTALEFERKEIAELLVKSGANPNPKCKEIVPIRSRLEKLLEREEQKER